MTTPEPRPALATAAGVTFTALPFGGAVLVDGTTFAVVECGDGDAALIAGLLDERSDRLDGPPAAGRPRRGDERWRRVARLVDEGWLVPRAAPAPPRGGSR